MAIEQHPIPQDVAGYKFRLIGDMTVKQFIWLAGGIILGLVTYSLPLPFFFKYPLTGLFVGLGAGIAFLPVEGRPMDKWLVAFIKSVYSPTQYTWQKSAAEQVSPSVSTARISPPVVTTVAVKPVTVSVPVTPPVAVPVTPQPVTPISQEKPVAPPEKPVTPVISTVAVPTPQLLKPVTPAAPAPSGNLPIPFTPTTPNTLVGMTLTPDGKILDGCLIEIKSNGISMRATKSNQLGQFLFAKPLENGPYQILTEKPGYTFEVYSLILTGQIVKPLRLQAKP